MYTPSYFDNPDLPALHDMLRRHPFALLVTPHAGEVHLTHLPFHLIAERGPKGTLEAHLARINPHCDAILAGAPSAVVFHGPDGYISPRWYVDPAKNVPTWNYVAVHVHGTPKPIAEPATLLALIGRLTDEHEAYIDKPWSIREAQAYVERLTGHILGFGPSGMMGGTIEGNNAARIDLTEKILAFLQALDGDSARLPIR